MIVMVMHSIHRVRSKKKMLLMETLCMPRRRDRVYHGPTFVVVDLHTMLHGSQTVVWQKFGNIAGERVQMDVSSSLTDLV